MKKLPVLFFLAILLNDRGNANTNLEPNISSSSQSIHDEPFSYLPPNINSLPYQKPDEPEPCKGGCNGILG